MGAGMNNPKLEDCLAWGLMGEDDLTERGKLFVIAYRRHQAQFLQHRDAGGSPNLYIDRMVDEERKRIENAGKTIETEYVAALEVMLQQEFARRANLPWWRRVSWFGHIGRAAAWGAVGFILHRVFFGG